MKFSLSLKLKNFDLRAVVVAQLVERLLPTAEICSSNPVIGRFIYYQHLLLNLRRPDKNNVKEEWAHIKKYIG